MAEATLDTAMAQTANTAPAAPAAPATTAPAASPATPATPAPRPTSWDEAFEQQPAAPEAIAATPPAAPETPVVPAPDPIATARTEAATETESRLMAQFQQELTPIRPVLPLAHAVAQDVQTGRITGLTQLLREYAQHPTLGPQLRSLLGRTLGQRGQPQAPQQPRAEPKPKPDLQFSDGTLQYSAEQQDALALWHANQVRQQYEAKLAPMTALQQRVQRVDQQQRQAQQAVDTSTRAVETWSQQPHFKDHAPAIAKEQQKLFEQGITDPAVSLGRAYVTVLMRDVLPRQTAQSQQRLVASAVAKATGRTDDPAAAAPAPPRRPKSWEEAFEQQGLRVP